MVTTRSTAKNLDNTDGDTGTQPIVIAQNTATRDPSPQPSSRPNSPGSDGTPRSYRDAVLSSRPDSPAVQHGGDSAIDGSLTEIQSERDSSADLSKMFSMDPVEEDGGPWTTVGSRRNRSRDSDRGRHGQANSSVAEADGGRTASSPVNRVLRLDQEIAVALAREAMTRKEKDLFDRRTNAVSVGHNESGSKGKGLDPRNWGEVGIPEEELNVWKQQEKLRKYERTSGIKDLEGGLTAPSAKREDLQQEEHTPSRRTDPDVKEGSRMAATAIGRVARAIDGKASPRNKKEMSPEVMPSAQVAAGSYLGTVLQGASKMLEDSDTEGSDTGTLSDSDGGDPDPGRIIVRETSKKKRQRTLIKPISLREYNGVADVRAYYRFVMEGTDYVRTGRVECKRRVFVLSRFLKGRAYDFYTQKIAVNPYSWDLQEFFEEMFDYCFPINYRMEQRDKLRRSFQHGKSVTDYCHELEELYNMIGLFDEQEKVVKLWNGL
ncbi:hypothetical protein C0989_002920 [Termitomyces sp. Mn162]|nr:hypothetical protein C0989_002920 [Termitomyces sp. Mn162]